MILVDSGAWVVYFNGHDSPQAACLERAELDLGVVPIIVRELLLFRSLRAHGITVRGAVDCVIAQTCIDIGGKLLTPDVDFVRIMSHSRLELVST